MTEAKRFISEVSSGKIKIYDDKPLKESVNGHFINTPDHIIDEMIDLLACNKKANVAVLYGLDIAYRLKELGYKNVTFFSDVEIKNNIATHKELGKMFKKNVILFNDIFEQVQMIKDKNMKFDAIIMNPPYNNRTNIRLSDNILVNLCQSEVSNNIVSIQPVQAIFTPTDRVNLQNKIKNIKYLKMVNGNTIWEGLASFKTPLGIIQIDKTHDGDIYYENNVCNMFNVAPKKYNSLIKQYIPRHHIQDNILNKIKSDNVLEDIRGIDANWYCNYNEMIGHMTNKNGYFYDSDMFRIVNEKGYNYNISREKFITGKDKNKHFYYGVDTYDEAKNCYDYCKSVFVKFLNINVKTSGATAGAKHIPLLDFTTPVTNERIQKEFNLTDLEMEFIEDFGKQLDGEEVDWSKYDKE
jgi:hypothetical protein